MVDHSYPQHGDEPDAANFAAMMGHSNLAPYITNLTITVDATVPEFNTTEAKAFSFINTFDTASPDISPTETRRESIVEHELDAKTGIALTDQDTNYVYLQPNVGTDDSPQYVVNTTGSAPDSDSFKVAEISPDSTVPGSSQEQFNRYPDISTSKIDAYDAIEINQKPGSNFAADLPELLFTDFNGDTVYLEMGGGSTFTLDMFTPGYDEFTVRFDNSASLYVGTDYVTADGRLRVRDSQGPASFSNIARDVPADGTATLSTGTAVIDTGISDNSATFHVALGVVDPDADAKVDYRMFWDDSDGTHKVEIFEDGTSVGGFDVNYHVIRVT